MKKETLQKGALLQANSSAVAQLKGSLDRLGAITLEEKKNLASQFDSIIKRLDKELDDLK